MSQNVLTWIRQQVEKHCTQKGDTFRIVRRPDDGSLQFVVKKAGRAVGAVVASLA